MSYHGDIRLEDTIDIKFVTTAAATGAPTTLAGTPVISAYPGNSTTQLTGGITLTVDFDGVTGLHNIRIRLGQDGRGSLNSEWFKVRLQPSATTIEAPLIHRMRVGYTEGTPYG